MKSLQTTKTGLKIIKTDKKLKIVACIVAMGTSRSLTNALCFVTLKLSQINRPFKSPYLEFMA